MAKSDVAKRATVLLISGILLIGCPKKKPELGDAGTDAAAEAGVPADASVATATDGTEADGAATPASTLPGAAKPATPSKSLDAGQGADAGAVDAGPAAQECCCEAGGQLASVPQSECTKTRKGQCVKKERCGGDAGAPQTCCCDAGGKKEVVAMGTCTKDRKGKCVKKTECR